MKNKILALLISLGSTIGIIGVFLLLFFFPNLCWVYISLSTLFLIYQGYQFWLKKLNNNDKSRNGKVG